MINTCGNKCAFHQIQNQRIWLEWSISGKEEKWGIMQLYATEESNNLIRDFIIEFQTP